MFRGCLDAHDLAFAVNLEGPMPIDVLEDEIHLDRRTWWRRLEFVEEPHVSARRTDVPSPARSAFDDDGKGELEAWLCASFDLFVRGALEHAGSLVAALRV